MSTALSVIWFGAAVGGAIAAVLGLFTHRAQRGAALMTAGVCFGVAGVLGILSIGIVFVALSLACFAAASRVRQAPAAAASDA